MKRNAKYVVDKLICPECGNAMYVPRAHGRRRSDGHIKDLWCPFCKKIQKMTEVRGEMT